MVHKSKKLTAVYALIMDLPLSIVITLISLILSSNLSGPMFIRMAILAYVITFFVNFLPAPKWGFDFAIKHSQPGTFKFGLLLNLVVGGVFCVILDLVMTAVGVLIFGGGTFQTYIVAVLGGFIPCYIPTVIIAMLWNSVADKVSRSIVGEPQPEIPTSF
jgi:hypothetical protein